MSNRPYERFYYDGMRIPEFEARRIKQRTVGRNGKKFRSAKKAIRFCQEQNIGQAIKAMNSFWEV